MFPSRDGKARIKGKIIYYVNNLKINVDSHVEFCVRFPVCGISIIFTKQYQQLSNELDSVRWYNRQDEIIIHRCATLGTGHAGCETNFPHINKNTNFDVIISQLTVIGIWKH